DHLEQTLLALWARPAETDPPVAQPRADLPVDFRPEALDDVDGTDLVGLGEQDAEAHLVEAHHVIAVPAAGAEDRAKIGQLAIDHLEAPLGDDVVRTGN